MKRIGRYMLACLAAPAIALVVLGAVGVAIAMNWLSEGDEQ